MYKFEFEGNIQFNNNCCRKVCVGGGGKWFNGPRETSRYYAYGLAGADPGGAGAGTHPWDGETRAEGAGSFVSRAERRDTGVP